MKSFKIIAFLLLPLLLGCPKKVPYSVVVSFFDLEDVQMITGNPDAPSITGRICKAQHLDQCLNQTVTLNKDDLDVRLFKNHELILDRKSNQNVLPNDPATASSIEYVLVAGNCRVPLRLHLCLGDNCRRNIQFQGFPTNLVTCQDDEGVEVYSGSRRQLEIINRYSLPPSSSPRSLSQ